jgi:hypothetical protein
LIQFFDLIASVIMEDGRRTTIERVIIANNLVEAEARMTTLCLKDETVDMVMSVNPNQ